MFSIPNNDGATGNEAQNANAGQGGAAQSNDGGQGTVERPSWLDQAPDSHKNNEAFYGYKAPGELMDAHMNLLSLKDRVAVPGENATDEERAAYNKAVGIPDKPEGYGFVKPSDMPEGVSWDQGAADAYAKFCYERGMTVEQGQANLEYFNGQIGKLVESADQELQKTVEANEKTLQDRLGNNYEPFMKTADQVLKSVVSEESVKMMEAEGMTVLALNSPGFISALYDLKEKVIGDNPISGDGAGKAKGPKTDPKTGQPMFDYPSMVKT
jgi:hypothetical protein